MKRRMQRYLAFSLAVIMVAASGVVLSNDEVRAADGLTHAKHSDSCYELICGLEEHTHEESCYEFIPEEEPTNPETDADPSTTEDPTIENPDIDSPKPDTPAQDTDSPKPDTPVQDIDSPSQDTPAQDTGNQKDSQKEDKEKHNNGNHYGWDNGNNGNHYGWENGDNGNHYGRENGDNGNRLVTENKASGGGKWVLVCDKVEHTHDANCLQLTCNQKILVVAIRPDGDEFNGVDTSGNFYNNNNYFRPYGLNKLFDLNKCFTSTEEIRGEDTDRRIRAVTSKELLSMIDRDVKKADYTVNINGEYKKLSEIGDYYIYYTKIAWEKERPKAIHLDGVIRLMGSPAPEDGDTEEKPAPTDSDSPIIPGSPGASGGSGSSGTPSTPSVPSAPEVTPGVTPEVDLMESVPVEPADMSPVQLASVEDTQIAPDPIGDTPPAIAQATPTQVAQSTSALAQISPVETPLGNIDLGTTGADGNLVQAEDVDAALSNPDIEHMCNILYFLILICTTVALYLYYRSAKKHNERIFELRSALGEDDPYKKDNK